MNATTAALAAAAEQLRGGRRSATRTLDLNLARAIARGRMPCLAPGVEETLLRELDAGSPARASTSPGPLFRWHVDQMEE